MCKAFQILYDNGITCRRITNLVYTGTSYIPHCGVCGQRFIDIHFHCVFIALAQGLTLLHLLHAQACTSTSWWPMPLDLYCSTSCCVFLSYISKGNWYYKLILEEVCQCICGVYKASFPSSYTMH